LNRIILFRQLSSKWEFLIDELSNSEQKKTRTNSRKGLISQQKLNW